MVQAFQVEKVADELRGRKARVSLRTVSEELRKQYRGGSNRDVGPLLLEWKAKRDYQPVIKLAGLPDAVAGRLALAAKDLWNEAQIEAARMLSAEREALKVRIRDEQHLRDEALVSLDAYQGEAELLKKENARLEAELGDVWKLLDESRRLMAEVRADHFWDRVMREVWAVLPPAGSLRVEAIEPLIGRDLVQESKSFGGKWGVGLLRKKLEVRDFHRKYVVMLGDGTFARRDPGRDAAAA